MRNILLAAILAAALPSIALAEKQMQNSNPSPEAVAEPTLGHHMQNSDPSPTPVAAAPEHQMQNNTPYPEKKTEVKKRISTNAAALEGLSPNK